MIRKYLLLIIVASVLCSWLQASQYKEEILSIYAKIVPRVLFMSSLKSRLKDEIAICIVRDDIDKNAAVLLTDLLHKNYPQGIRNMALHVDVVDFTSSATCKDVPLIFLFNSTTENIKKLLQFTHNQIVVSYSDTLLGQGADVSLFIGRRVMPYLNMQNLAKKKISLHPTLLRVSKIYNP